MKLLISMIFVFCSWIGSSQEAIRCEDIVNDLEKNKKVFQSLSEYDLFYDASWLKGIKCYEVQGAYYVVAEMKLDDFGLKTKKYLYCDIPIEKWKFFFDKYACCPMDMEGYGKRFHKYIADYKCLCE